MVLAELLPTSPSPSPLRVGYREKWLSAGSERQRERRSLSRLPQMYLWLFIRALGLTSLDGELYLARVLGWLKEHLGFGWPHQGTQVIGERHLTSQAKWLAVHGMAKLGSHGGMQDLCRCGWKVAFAAWGVSVAIDYGYLGDS